MSQPFVLLHFPPDGYSRLGDPTFSLSILERLEPYRRERGFQINVTGMESVWAMQPPPISI